MHIVVFQAAVNSYVLESFNAYAAVLLRTY